MSASARRKPVRLVLVTGLSGSGKSSVAKCFEDLGYYCVDNLPLSLLRPLLRAPSEHLGEERRVAVVTDVRAPGFDEELPRLLAEIDRDVVQPTLVFLEASDETLVRRFSETRRRHPLTGPESSLVIDAIVQERQLMAEFRGVADVILDTSEWSVHEMRRQVRDRFGDESAPHPRLVVSLVSFGFKHGIPYGTDLLFDARFLPNPYFDPKLRPLRGDQAPVRSFLQEQTEFGGFVERLADLLEYLLPQYRKENRSYLTVAVGCTGGRHRSVAVCEELARSLDESGWVIRIDHRDIDKEAARG